MKCIKQLYAISLALIASAILAPAANAGCNNATLQGHYGFTFSGFSYGALGNGTVAGVGSGYFDGHGNFKQASFDYSVGGVPQSTNGTVPGALPVQPFGSSYAATYKVFDDCSGVLTGENGGDNFTFIIVAGGMEIFAVDISANDPTNLPAGGGNTITLDLKKVSSD